MMKPKSTITPSIDLKLIDSLIKQYDDPMDIFRENGLMMQFKKAVVERMMEGELTTELGYEKNDSAGNNSGNSRNGYTEKTLKCNDGRLPIKVPRDRNGDYEPKIIPKNQTRFDDMDDKIYPIVYMDALVIKVQQDKRVINKAFYLALGVNTEGKKNYWVFGSVKMKALNFG